jgi:LDH2 family malate/lactate/ureidoglycolate dehydrogenase
MPTLESSPVYSATDLVAFARALFQAAGCDDDKPQTITELLVEADLMGHTTHGLALASAYLEELESGAMKPTGSPRVLSERSAVIVWDGEYLPGVWLTAKALDLAGERARAYGLCAIAIRRSHHIACLAAYLQRATARGLMAIITSSDPSDASVAPFGGRKPVFTPDPIAVGIPTGGDPILIDMSASITTNGMSARLRAEGKRYPGLWALDADSNPTNDPSVLIANPPGSILPTGGLDHGHKGYALALFIEALTQGLSGHGRAEAPSQWGASTFVQVFEPEAFGGLADFRREMDWISEACRANPPVLGATAVRLPGQAALSRRRDSLAEGVRLYPGVMEALAPWATKFGVQLPGSHS